MSTKVISIGVFDYFGRLEVRWTPDEYGNHETYHDPKDLGIDSETITRFYELNDKLNELFNLIKREMRNIRILNSSYYDKLTPWFVEWSKHRDLVPNSKNKGALLRISKRNIVTYEQQYEEYDNELKKIQNYWLMKAKRLESRSPLVMAWAMANPEYHNDIGYACYSKLDNSISVEET